jgi:hypothetical protein
MKNAYRLLGLVMIISCSIPSFALAINEPNNEGEGVEDIIPTSENSAPIPTSRSAPASNQRTADFYRQQVGLSTSSEIGTRKESLVIPKCKAFQGAGTFNKGVENKCSYQLPKELADRGWVIVGSRVEVTDQSKKKDRSGTRTEILAAGGYTFDYDKEVGSKFKAAIKAAVEAGDIKAQKELELEYQKHRENFRFSEASHNTFNLYAWANGGFAAKASIEANGYVILEKLW